MLVHEAQMEVIAERVHVHQVPHLVTLLCEQHGQLGRQQQETGLGCGCTGCPIHVSFLLWKEVQFFPCCCGPVECPLPEWFLWEGLPFSYCIVTTFMKLGPF